MFGAFHKLAFALLLLATPGSLWSQQDRITAPIDSARIVRLNGNLRPAMLRRNDGGRVNAAFPIPAMTLFLKPSAGQQSDLRQLLEDQRNPASPLYHRWLTPEEFADRFGPSRGDIAAAADWLRSQGFAVGKVARSRRWIVFSGTSAQVENAFHTEIHRYRLEGKDHYANAAEPFIPEALAEVVLGVDGLDDFLPETVQPELTAGSVHTLAPDDLAKIYDITPVYQSGIDGAGQKIAVMGTSQFPSGRPGRRGAVPIGVQIASKRPAGGPRYRLSRPRREPELHQRSSSGHRVGRRRRTQGDDCLCLFGHVSSRSAIYGGQ